MRPSLTGCPAAGAVELELRSPSAGGSGRAAAFDLRTACGVALFGAGGWEDGAAEAWRTWALARTLALAWTLALAFAAGRRRSGCRRRLSTGLRQTLAAASASGSDAAAS